MRVVRLCIFALAILNGGSGLDAGSLNVSVPGDKFRCDVSRNDQRSTARFPKLWARTQNK